MPTTGSNGTRRAFQHQPALTGRTPETSLLPSPAPSTQLHLRHHTAGAANPIAGHSHQLPVQLGSFNVVHQLHELPFELVFEAHIILNNKRLLQFPVHHLKQEGSEVITVAMKPLAFPCLLDHVGREKGEPLPASQLS